jgi:hypothetical protein
MGMLGVTPEPPVKCSYCSNAGKMSANEIRKILPQLEEIRKKMRAQP